MNPLDWINRGLISEPMNWGIVFLIATIWLLLFHYLMVGFTAMQQGPGAVPQAPGSGLAIPPTPSGPLGILPSGPGIWTDGVEARYAEDGWTAA